ncbi:probable serine hydrolase isoform X1 [Bacillus rossius redtenbacheri]|uniref:probable serine hydrolase isoform X1 n=1 Tax=Bacillus rossius redtenbacheri TaxID=93214 RepID=UPI002FDCE24A
MLICRKLQHVKQAHSLLSRLYTQAATAQQNHRPVQEIVIPVPWGHIAGKWWGRTDVQPILGLHGWEDNANTFDALVPHLNVESFLAIDFVGHGMSSHLPVGRFYNYLDFVLVVRMLQQHFKWRRFSVLGHSLGSSVGFIYAGLYPDAVDTLVSIECAHSLVMGNKTFELEKMKLTIDKSLALEKQLGKGPPAYELDEMVQLLYEGVHHTLSLDACRTLLQRGTRATEKNGKEYHHFSRDPRLRVQWLGRLTEDIYYATAKRVACKALYIRAKQGLLFGGDEERVYLNTIGVLKNSALRFEYHEVDGTHHTHLNTPLHVAPIINKYLECLS